MRAILWLAAFSLQALGLATLSSAAPAITAQPVSVTATAGQSATFIISATADPAASDPTLAFQWKSSPDGDVWTNITDADANTTTAFTATSGTLVIDNITDAMNGSQYLCAVTDTTGETNSDIATLTVVPAIAPALAWAPGSTDALTVNQGLKATFAVELTAGTDPLTYTWEKSGTVIEGATGATYTTPDTTLADDGAIFTISATNAAGIATLTSTLTVTPAVAPALAWTSGADATGDLTVDESADAVFTATLTAGTADPITYTWARNGSIVAITATNDATATYTFSGVPYSYNSSTISVSAANPAGSATISATLTVIPSSTTRANLFANQVSASDPATTVTVTGTLNLSLAAGGLVTVAPGKTISGADSNATLTGTLSIPAGSGNIVILGVNFTDGALAIDGATGVDISHCTFTDAPVAITGNSDNISLSWNLFAATAAGYPIITTDTTGAPVTITITTTSAMRIDHSGASVGIILHHNLWDTSLPNDMPAATNSRVFMFNNYIAATNNATATISGSGAQILSERNIYEGTHNPYITQSTGLLRAIDNDLIATTGTTAPGDSKVFSLGYSQLMHSAGAGTPGTAELIALITATAGNTAGQDSLTPPMTDADADATISGTATGLGATATDTSINLPKTGGGFTLTASATNFTPVPSTQQWYLNNFPIAAATGPTYGVDDAVYATDAGAYTLVQTTPHGEILTTGAFPVTIGAITAPVITVHPMAQVITLGDDAMFTVAATGVDLTYQWRRNGAAISGATSDTFSITDAQRTDAGTYTVVVSNTIGSAYSLPATLTISGNEGFASSSGGGAPSLWWLGALAMLAALRRIRRHFSESGE